MCLQVLYTKNNEKTARRWKFLHLNGDGVFESPSWISHGYRWNAQDWNHSSACDSARGDNQIDEQEGFHVMVKRGEAQKAMMAWQIVESDPLTRNLYLVLLEVNGFKSAGFIENSGVGADGYLGEIWKSARIVEVYDRTGKDVTDQFIPVRYPTSITKHE